jgi:hypothetical protein
LRIIRLFNAGIAGQDNVNSDLRKAHVPSDNQTNNIIEKLEGFLGRPNRSIVNPEDEDHTVQEKETASMSTHESETNVALRDKAVLNVKVTGKKLK